MSRPKPGENYEAVTGDTLPIIASRAYGLSEKWPLIKNANQFKFKVDNQEQVQPGEVLYIPFDPELVALKNQQSSL